MLSAHLGDMADEETAICKMPPKRSSNLDEKSRKLLLLLGQHVQNFQRSMFTSRRRYQQRMRRRQTLLRAFYMQQLLEVENCFLELLPLPSGVVAIAADDEENDCSSEMAATTDSDGHDVSAQTLRRRRTAAALRFYEDVVERFSDVQWLAAFRMSKPTFRWLCAQLRDALLDTTADTTTITLEKRVALALYAFVTGDDYRSVAVLFDVSAGFVWKLVKRFAAAVLQKLGGCLLAMPQREQEFREIREALQLASNMPAAAVGVLGHVTLPVKSLTTSETNATTTSRISTILLQTLIDDRLLFRKVQVELSQRRPSLFLDAPNEITKLTAQPINGERLLPCFVVAPASAHYPLRPWLMQSYVEPVAPHEYDFNEAVDNLLLIRERAFRRLFARWKIVQRKVDLDARTMETIVVACCALHNFLEEQQEPFLSEWTENVDVTSFLVGDNAPAAAAAVMTTANEEEEALEIRDYLARTISSTEM